MLMVKRIRSLVVLAGISTLALVGCSSSDGDAEAGLNASVAEDAAGETEAEETNPAAEGDAEDSSGAGQNADGTFGDWPGEVPLPPGEATDRDEVGDAISAGVRAVAATTPSASEIEAYKQELVDAGFIEVGAGSGAYTGHGLAVALASTEDAGVVHLVVVVTAM